MKILSGVSDEFVTQFTAKMGEFPIRWLDTFRNLKYKIILAPKISDAYKAENIPVDPFITDMEKTRPESVFGATCLNLRDGSGFFMFADMPRASEFAKNIVNHEFSHGIVNGLYLNKQPMITFLLNRDINAINSGGKLQKLTKPENELFMNSLLTSEKNLNDEEVLADLIARFYGGGVYGCGIQESVKNPDFVKDLFPNTYDYLCSLLHSYK